LTGGNRQAYSFARDLWVSFYIIFWMHSADTMEDKISNGVLFAVGVFAVLIFLAVIVYLLRCSGVCQKCSHKLYTSISGEHTLSGNQPCNSGAGLLGSSGLGTEVYGRVVDESPPLIGEWRRMRKMSLPINLPIYSNILSARGKQRSELNQRFQDSHAQASPPREYIRMISTSLVSNNAQVAPPSEYLRMVSTGLPPPPYCIGCSQEDRNGSPPPEYDKLESDRCVKSDSDVDGMHPPSYNSVDVDAHASSLTAIAA